MGDRAHEGEAPSPAVGAVVENRYEIVSRLGAGGMAEVFRARDRSAGREVALKVIRDDVATQPEAVERIRREAEVLAELDHPAIVSIDRSGRLEDGRVFLAMELLEGETLRDRMRRGPMEPEELVPIVSGVASGVEAAHRRGILHRDLKPDNLFLCGTRDGVPQVKILDFGVSKVFGRNTLTQTGQILGTPRYMAPEQLTAERDLDGRVDVYALGVILYEALAGQPPFIGNDPAALIVAIVDGHQPPLRSMRAGLPPGLAAVVERAMARDRSDRYGSMAELVRELVAHAGPVDGPVRAQVRTDALGSMEAPATPGPDEGDGALVPGTYSAFVRSEPPAEPPRRTAVEASEPVEIVPQQRSEARPSPRVQELPRVDRVPEPSEPVRLPTTTRRSWIVAGVIAGVLTAALVLWMTSGFGLFEGRPAQPAQPPAGARARAPRPPADPAFEAPSPEPAPQASDGPASEPSSPRARDQGGEASSERAPGPADRRRARAIRSRADDDEPTPAPALPSRSSSSSGEDEASAAPQPAADGPAPSPAASGDPAPSEPVPPPPAPVPTEVAAPDEPPSAPDLLRQARAARASKDYARCSELVDRALSSGAPASALRLRGDCLQGAGDRSGALQAYRRFCRLVPDHPAIGEVRGIVEGMGTSCP